jgi:cell division protein ZapA (FtsZ GTPase activity inhibitor)
VAVDIAGEKHVLRSDVPPEYTRSVAAHVDATIRALPGFQTLEPFRAATLAALSITDELFRAREEIRKLREEAEYRTNILAEQLEAASAAAAEKRPVRRPAAASPAVSWTAEPEPAVPPPLPGDTERPPVEVVLEPVSPPPLPGPEPAWAEEVDDPAGRGDADEDDALAFPPAE